MGKSSLVSHAVFIATKTEAQTQVEVAAPTVTKDIRGDICHYYAHSDNGDGKSKDTARLPVKAFLNLCRPRGLTLPTPDMPPV